MEVIRSWLIAPANRPDYLRKFPTIGADCSVIDLEDGTPEHEKAAARADIGERVAQLRQAGLRNGLYVRTNHPASSHIDADLQAALAADIDGIVIPKLETPEELRRIARVVAEAGRRRQRAFGIIGGIETARGVLNVSRIADADSHLVALYFGAEDFATDLLGARRTPENTEVLYARSRVVLAAKAARICAIDQGVLEIHNDERFRADAEQARNLGYDGKVCLNPRQVQLANEIFRPSQAEIEFSRGLVATYEEAERQGIGTINYQGMMVDGPLLKRCRHILRLADAGPRA